MIQLVGDNVILGAKDRRDGAGIGRETRLEHHAGFDILEACDALLELHVQGHGAGDGAHRTRAHAKLACGCERRFHQFWMSCEPEIIVGREIDDIAAVETRLRRARRFQNAQPLIGTRLAPRLQLPAQVRQRIAHRFNVWSVPGAEFQTFSGTTNGSRYFRVNIAVASASPLQLSVAASNSRVRPTRYEMLARCTSTVDM